MNAKTIRPHAEAITKEVTAINEKVEAFLAKNPAFQGRIKIGNHFFDVSIADPYGEGERQWTAPYWDQSTDRFDVELIDAMTEGKAKICPECGSSDTSSCDTWTAASEEDSGNEARLLEHQCQNCGAAFWCGYSTKPTGHAAALKPPQDTSSGRTKRILGHARR